MISLIVAVSQNRVIGSNNRLPWHIPEDLQHFKRLTSGNTIIMGRRTFESLPCVLSDRHHIVLSASGAHFHDPSVTFVPDEVAAIRLAKTIGRDCFVIGGSKVYETFLPYVDFIFETNVRADYSGDVYFKSIDKKAWDLVYPLHLYTEPTCQINLYRRKHNGA